MEPSASEPEWPGGEGPVSPTSVSGYKSLRSLMLKGWHLRMLATNLGTVHLFTQRRHLVSWVTALGCLAGSQHKLSVATGAATTNNTVLKP